MHTLQLEAASALQICQWLSKTNKKQQYVDPTSCVMRLLLYINTVICSHERSNLTLSCKNIPSDISFVSKFTLWNKTNTTNKCQVCLFKNEYLKKTIVWKCIFIVLFLFPITHKYISFSSFCLSYISTAVCAVAEFFCRFFESYFSLLHVLHQHFLNE